MGAQTSSAGGHGQSSNPSSRTCYYELLGVEPQSTDQEIKKAYRRKALELHPDRNFNDEDVATKKFAEIQVAYEVLSDPRERAWYDSHRDAILRGQDSTDGQPESTTFRNIRLTTTEEILGLMRKCNAATPFNDEPTGFFGISRETFEHLALEEEAAADSEGTDCPIYPTFGCSDDEYETIVRAFYSSWAGFSTKKTFFWKDKYRLSDAPDRRVRRLMEKENKKLREEAIREFNDAVRFLVLFVRKRDPRYLPNLRTESERQESLRSASAAQAARSRAANLEKLSAFEVPEWARANDVDSEQNHTADEEESEEESEVEILECVVCNKTFKSNQQLEAHERSKKHIKALQQLRRQMQKEGIDFALDSGTARPHEARAGSSCNEQRDSHYTEKRANPAELSISRTGSKVGMEDRILETQDDIDDGSASLRKLHTPSHESSADDRSLKDADAATVTTSDLSQSTTSFSPSQTATLSSEDAVKSLASSFGNVSVGQIATQEIKLGKAKAKRQRKAIALQTSESEHRCSVCNATFISRTQLFHHIRAENHAAPVSQAGHVSSKKGRG